MKIQQIKIRNILGIVNLDIEPKKVTVLSGENGSGKTSALEAIKSVFSGGHDASLIHQGAESGEVVVVFDDGMTATKTITKSKSNVTVEAPKLGAIKKPATYLSGLVDLLGLNPIEFLLSPAKARTQMLLESMPIELDDDDINPIIQRSATARETEDPLSFIASERQRFYDERTGVNRTAKDKRATIEQMKATLPADDTIDWAKMVKTLSTQLEDREQATQNAIEGFRKQVSDGKAAIDADSRALVDVIKTKLADDISRLRAEADAKIEDIYAKANVGRDDIQSNGFRAIETLQAAAAPEKEQLTSKLAVARENLSNQAKISQTKEYINTLATEATAAEVKAVRCSDAIDALDKLKLKLLSKLPIKGVEIRDGQIYVNDIVFDRLNESQKVRLAIDIAKLRAGALDLIIVDGLERLDEKTFAQFKKQIAKESAQFIVTRVSDAAFSVEAQ